MGSDIHAHIEIKIAGQWHHYHAHAIPRNYPLFARIAGVRQNHSDDCKYPVRGLPDDMSTVTRIDYSRDHYHTPSWITAAELDEVQRWYEAALTNALANTLKTGVTYPLVFAVFGYLFQDGYNPEKGENGVEDVRMVFWFDN